MMHRKKSIFCLCLDYKSALNCACMCKRLFLNSSGRLDVDITMTNKPFDPMMVQNELRSSVMLQARRKSNLNISWIYCWIQNISIANSHFSENEFIENTILTAVIIIMITKTENRRNSIFPYCLSLCLLSSYRSVSLLQTLRLFLASQVPESLQFPWCLTHQLRV